MNLCSNELPNIFILPIFKLKLIFNYFVLSTDTVDSSSQPVTDFGFEEHFNHGLRVEEKKNRQNRIVAPREAPPPPTPPLPPRKGSYTPSVALAASLLPKDRPPQLQTAPPVRQE